MGDDGRRVVVVLDYDGGQVGGGAVVVRCLYCYIFSAANELWRLDIVDADPDGLRVGQAMRRCRQRGRKVAGAGRRGPRLDDPRAVGDVVKHDLYGFRPACARGDRSDGVDVYGRKCKRERDGIAVGVVGGYDGRLDAIGVDVDARGGGDDRGGVWTDQDIVDDSRLVVGRGGGLQPKVGRRRGAVADPHGVYGRILPCRNRAVVRCRSGPRRAIGRMLEGEHGRRTAGK